MEKSMLKVELSKEMHMSPTVHPSNYGNNDAPIISGLSLYEHHYRMLRNYGKLDEGFNNYYSYAKLKNLAMFHFSNVKEVFGANHSWVSHEWRLKVSRLPKEKEIVYGALDKWVAWETEFPLIAAAKALRIFKKKSQWLRVIQ
ncbi:hypothetical protein Gogos_018186, partial [Gossypium gossypioides]|nr:hypothetical protein [Gossypium gossypioides]